MFLNIPNVIHGGLFWYEGEQGSVRHSEIIKITLYIKQQLSKETKSGTDYYYLIFNSILC